MEPFRNEPFSDFTQSHEQEALRKALETVRGQLDQAYPLWINGQPEWSDDRWIESYNPAQVDQRMGRVAQADVNQAIRAIEAASRVRTEWATVSVEDRARILWRAAGIMRRRKHELSAWLVMEAGKTWPEADGETAEAIDFLEYYGLSLIHI